jgi:hypothetical protein
MKLLNVRLGPDDARMAAQLREAGIPISRIVRDALRAAHERHAAVRAPRRRPSQIMAQIYKDHPDPPGIRRRRRDLTDSEAVRRVIRQRLRRRRP